MDGGSIYHHMGFKDSQEDYQYLTMNLNKSDSDANEVKVDAL